MSTSPAPQPAEGERCVCGHDALSHDFADDRGACAWGRDVGQEDDCMSWRPTTPASAEPTEGDREVARQWVAAWFTDPALDKEPTSGLLARALASQRAEIVARYDKVAAEVERRHLDGLPVMVLDVVDRIREAAPK